MNTQNVTNAVGLHNTNATTIRRLAMQADVCSPKGDNSGMRAVEASSKIAIHESRVLALQRLRTAQLCFGVIQILALVGMNVLHW